MEELKVTNIRIQNFLREKSILPVRINKLTAFYEDTDELREALIYFMKMTEYGFYEGR